MNIHIPISQEVRYRPGVMETLKFAWVQYILVLIPALYVTRELVTMMFKFRIFEALLVSDLKPNKKII